MEAKDIRVGEDYLAALSKYGHKSRARVVEVTSKDRIPNYPQPVANYCDSRPGHAYVLRRLNADGTVADPDGKLWAVSSRKIVEPWAVFQERKAATERRAEEAKADADREWEERLALQARVDLALEHLGLDGVQWPARRLSRTPDTNVYVTVKLLDELTALVLDLAAEVA